MDRQFYADRPNEKWLTDVTEFHYYTGTKMRKLYLSAILDLCDRRIVSFVIRGHQRRCLGPSHSGSGIEGAIPAPAPLLHSDRGSAYTTSDLP